MTMLCEEALATPSQRLLRIGQEHPGVADAYAEAHAVLLAYRDADPYVYASLSAHALAILGVGAQLSASIQFVGADDPRQVLFDRIMIASASALAGAALMATTGPRSPLWVIPALMRKWCSKEFLYGTGRRWRASMR